MKLFKKSLFLCSLLFLSIVDTRVGFAAFAEDAAKMIEEEAENLAGRLTEDGAAASEEMVANSEKALKDSLSTLPKDVLENPEALKAAVQDASKGIEEQLGNTTKDLEGLETLSKDPKALESIGDRAGESGQQALKSLEDSGQISKTTAEEAGQGLKAGDSAAGDLGENVKAPEEAPDAMKPEGNGEGSTPEGERSELKEKMKKEHDVLREENGHEYNEDGKLVDKKGNVIKDSEGNEIGKETAGQKAKRWAKTGVSKAGHMIADQVVMLAFMTVPQVIQEEMQSAAQRKAALGSAAALMTFGNWSMQVVDSCLNTDNPDKSLPFYQLFPTVEGGVFDASKLSFFKGKGIDISYAHGEDAKKWDKDTGNYDGADLGVGRMYVRGNRNDYYQYAPIVVSYPDSYGNCADSMLSSPEFGGYVIDLMHGVVIDATGTITDEPLQPPLVAMKNHAPTSQSTGTIKSVAHWMPKLLNKLNSSGLEYSTTAGYVASVAQPTQVSSTIKNLFNCTEADLVKLTNTEDSEAVGQKDPIAAASKVACMLRASCDAYNEHQTFGVFGPVAPVHGWGTKSMDDLPINKANFSHNVPLAADKSGVITQDLGSAFAKNKAKQQADEDKTYTYGKTDENYAVQGCWIYTCAGTPFAKAVQQGSKDTSVKGPYVDYVIFLDEDGNQVPLHGIVKSDVWDTWYQVGLNPKAKYMASLISTGMPEFQIQNTVVAYDAQGQAAGIPNLQQTVQTVINGTQQSPGLGAFPKIKAQFEAHKQALISKYYYGPFKYGNSKLTADTDYNLTAQGQVVMHVYTGRNCYGSTGSQAVRDILIAENKQGNMTALPNENVAKFISLVTDIVYTVDPKTNTLMANTESAFKSAPGTWNGKTFVKDSTKADTLTWLPYLKKAYAQSNEAFDDASYSKLLDEVTKLREQWFNSELVSGVAHNGMTFELASELDIVEAEKNNCFIYEVSPSPSGAFVDKDWFIAVDFKQPSLSHLSKTDFINMAADADKALSMVSLVTGNIYDMNGQQVVDTIKGANHPATISLSGSSTEQTAGEQLLNFINSVYGQGQGLTSDFEQEYKAEIARYKKVANRIILEGKFGTVSLGIYAGDMAMGNYVYFNTKGMGNPDHFTPEELFVTVDPSDKANMFGKPLSSNTEMILSLASGQVFDAKGPKMVISSAIVNNYVSANSVYWRPWLRTVLAKLQVAHNAKQAANKNEMKALEKANKTGDQNLIWTPEVVKQRIARLQAVPFLPAPYATLKQDPLTQEYVRLAPASLTNTNEYNYTFFTVPNTYKDAEGKPMQIGAIYSPEGQLITTIKGAGRQAMMSQYGLYGDGKVTIGAPMLQPSLILSDEDKNIKPGQSTGTMIVSMSDNFPGNKVRMPAGYYLYFSCIMNSYYVLDTKNNQWFAVNSGHVYNRDGQPIPLVQDVALDTSRNSADMLLLQKNKAGNMQGIMKNPVHDDMYTSWTNFGTGEWKCANGKAMVKPSAKNKRSLYTVTFENVSGTKQQRKIYQVDGTHEWQGLVFLPIGKDRKILTKLPRDKSLQSAQIITVKGQLTNTIFKDTMYRLTTSKGQSVYEMTAVDEPNAEPIEVQMLVDPNTNVPYIKVLDGLSQGAQEYRYGYVYQDANSDETSAMQADVIKGAVTVSPVSMKIGKFAGKNSASKYLGSTTHTLFAANIADADSMQQVQPADVQNLPSQDTSEYGVVVGMITSRVFQSKDGRYFVSLYPQGGTSSQAPFISYFNRNGFVDVYTGSLFDDQGIAVGESLSLDDWMKVLNTVRVSVIRDEKGKLGLFYRNASAIKAQQSQLTATSAPRRARDESSQASGRRARSASPVRRDNQMLGTTRDSLPPVRDARKVSPQVPAATRRIAQQPANNQMLGTTRDSLPPVSQGRRLLGTTQASKGIKQINNTNKAAQAASALKRQRTRELARQQQGQIPSNAVSQALGN